MDKKTRTLFFAGILLSVGCAGGSTAPFHMYDSPMLQSEVHPARLKSRTFDPLKVGDFGVTDVYVAEAPAVSPEVAKKKVSTPAVATRPKPIALSTRTGGKPDSLETGNFPAVTGHNPVHSASFAVQVIAANGVTPPDATKTSISELYKYCKSEGKVSHDSANIGDLVFFHNVVDANRDGRNNDWYTHVGVVESKKGDVYTVQGFAHGAVQKHQLRLGKDEPTEASARLRDPAPNDPPFTQYYTSELFAGFCGVLGDKPELVMIDSWTPAD